MEVQNQSENNKRIAINTLLLYARMLLILVISLYTSRVVLATLGVEDYGIYNVVGGVVTMFTFLNYAMSNSSHRYITYALGKGNKHELYAVVSVTCMIHLAIAIIILLLAETVGLWFLHNKMVIPEDRMAAACWVYQFSIVSCITSIICVPFNAIIIAHEKMEAYAFISILDAFLKLVIVFLIQAFVGDKLIYYAALVLLVSLLDVTFYILYCRAHFDEARHVHFKRYKQINEMTSFAGWSLIGNLAYIGYTQGLNLLLNLFFGPIVNAARGVAVQVEGAIKGFVANFQTAVNPQIVKSYAQEDFSRLHRLIYSSSKLGFYLLLCLVLPVCVESKMILSLWLKEVPDYAVLFTVLVLLVSLQEPLRNPIDRANQATGNIKKYQIFEGGSLLLILPFAYLALKLGGQPYWVFLVQLIIMYLVQILRLFLVCSKIHMSKREYFKQVLFKVAVVSLVSSALPITLHFLMPHTILSSAIVVCISVMSVLFSSYFFGLDVSERTFVNGKIYAIRDRFYNFLNKRS